MTDLYLCPPVDPVTGPLPGGPATGGISRIIERVSAETGVPEEAIKGRRRLKIIVKARHEAMRRAHDHGYSSVQIGRVFRRDHTTVLWAIRKGR